MCWALSQTGAGSLGDPDKVFILMETVLEQGTHRTNQLVKRTPRSDREGNPQGLPGELGFGWRGLGRPPGGLKDGEEAKHAKGGEERSGSGNRKYKGPAAAKSLAFPRSEGQCGEGAGGEAGEVPRPGRQALRPGAWFFCEVEWEAICVRFLRCP